MMLHSILGDALTLGSQGAAAFKPLAQATTSTVTSAVATATSAVTNSVATATSAVTSATTSTVAATPTGSILNQITSVATPIAAPATTGSGSFGFHNPLDWGWLTTYPTPPMGQFAWLFFIICLAVLVISLYLLFAARNRYRDIHSLNYRVINKYAPWFLSVSAAGLFFVLLRLPIWPGPSGGSGPFEFGGQRIWLYLVFFTLIGMAVWFFRYYPARYRADLADWQKRAVRRQYDPASVRRVGATTTPGGSPTGVKRRSRR